MADDAPVTESAIPDESKPSTPTVRSAGRVRSAWWVPILLVVAVALAAAGPIAKDWLVGRAAYDHLHYHLPAIERFIDELPAVDLVDYASATTPGYHLVVAGAGRLGQALGLEGPILLRWLGLGFTLGLVGVVGAWTVRRMGPMALAVCAPLAASLYVYSSGVWLLPDNAGWLGVWLVLTLALKPRTPHEQPTTSRRWWWFAVSASLVWLVLARQIHIWALGPVMVALWLDRSRLFSARDAVPALSLREAAAVLKPERARINGALLGVGLGLPAILVLGAFVALWGGLVPPRFADFHASTRSPASAAFFLSLCAGFGVFFIGWWWRGLMELAKRRRGLLMTAAAFGLVSALLPATSYSVEAGRYGALWSVGARLPTLADRSLLITALAPMGAVVLASWLVLVDVRSRWVLMVSIAGFAAASSFNSIAGQRYYEPFVLMLMVLLSGREAACRTGSARHAARWAGPAVLAAVLAVLTAATLMRSAPMRYPDQPRGLEPLAATAPLAEPSL